MEYKQQFTQQAQLQKSGILDPSRFSGQIRKVEARLGKLAKIRKVETNQESSSKRLGKLEVRPKKKRSSPNIGWDIRKVEPNQESSSGIIGKLGKFIRKIRKVHLEDQENSESSLGKLGKKSVRQESLLGKLGKLEVRPKKKKGPHLILVGKLGKFDHIRKVHQANQENFCQIRKIFTKLGKFHQIRKTSAKLGKFIRKIRKFHQKDKRKIWSSPNFGWEIRKAEPNQESSFEEWENQES